MDDQKKRTSRATSGGVYVIVVVGIFLLLELNLDWGATGNIVFAASVVVGTILLAWLAKRFIDRHGNQIGEASFSGKSEPDHDGES